MTKSRSWQARLFATLLIVGSAGAITGCGSLGREINQSLPEFMREDPGAEEVERYQTRVRVINRSAEEVELAKQAFAEAKGLHEQERHDDAIDAFEDFLEAYPDTDDDKEARYLLIQSYLANEDAADAKRAIEAFAAAYPISVYNDELEEVAWDLAHEYLDGKYDFLFISRFDSGVDLLRLITTNFPNGIHADEAHWELANIHFDEREYIEAISAYKSIVERYPRSRWAPRSRYNVGLCHIVMTKGNVYDERNMRRGIEAFRIYLDKVPEGDRRGEAEEHIATLQSLRAQKQIEVARWYLSQDQPLAARFYLARCVTRFADTPEVEEARDLLASLPEIDDEEFYRDLEIEIPESEDPNPLPDVRPPTKLDDS